MPRTLSRRAFLTGGRATVAEAPRRPGALDGGAVRHVAELAATCLAVNGVTCSICADPCESSALRVKPLMGGRALPVIDIETCTGCGDCVRLCPVGALAVVATTAASEDAACA